METKFQMSKYDKILLKIHTNKFIINFDSTQNTQSPPIFKKEPSLECTLINYRFKQHATPPRTQNWVNAAWISYSHYFPNTVVQ